MKNKKIVFVLAAAMLLAACGKGNTSSSVPDSSAETPASSQATPTSSEAPAASSSSKETPVSSSSSSQAPVVQATMETTGCDLVVENGKAYAIVKGTASGYKAGEFKFAWGFEHVTEVDGGEGFAYGSAEPADADYKEVVTIAADGTFTAKFCLSDIPGLASGLYKVYAGAKGFYGNVAAAKEIGSSRVKDSKFAYNYRFDEQCGSVAAIAVDALPPVALQEALAYAEGDQTWVKIGGEATITEAEAATYDPFVQFQNVNNWRNTKMDASKIKWDFSAPGKAYICINVTGVFVAGANFNTHLNLKENKQQDCKMDVAIDEHYIVNGLDIEVFSDPTTTEAGAVGFWGNLGWRITKAPVIVDPTEKTVTKTSATLVVEDGKAYAVVSGKTQNVAAADLKFAWGFEHITVVDGGEGFAYGSAEPADADYKESVTLAADGTYTAKFCLTDAGLDAGLYKVYAGAKGFYGTISAEDEDVTIAGDIIKDNNYQYNYRKDDQCDKKAAIAIDSLPPIKLTSATVYEEDGQAWVKIGGELRDKYKDLTEADPSWNPFVNFQQVGGRWTNTRVQGDNLKWDFSEEGYAYLCINVNFFAAGSNYNTHINMTENKQQDCKMEVDINETYIAGGKQIQVYSNTKASTSDQNEFWGNLGFRVTNAPKAAISAEACEGVTNVKFAEVAWNDTTWTFDPVGTPSETLDVTKQGGKTIQVTWESERKVTNVYVNGEPANTGDGKAFFTTNDEDDAYVVTFEVADSRVVWEDPTEHIEWMDVEILVGGDIDNTVMAQSDPSIDWSYTEGDVIKISPTVEEGYEIVSVKVNDIECELVVGSDWFWGDYEYYAAEVPEAGDYTITFVTQATAPAVDTSISWSADTEGLAYFDVSVYPGDEEADVIYPEEDGASSLEWAYAEGDMVMILAIPEEGKVISSVKVNGEDCIETPVPGPGGTFTAYAYYVEEAGEYEITIETEDAVNASVTWSSEIEGVSYIDVSVYPAEGDVIAIEDDEQTSLDWKYAEGDMIMIMAIPEDGKVITSVKVNGEDCTPMPVPGPEGAGFTAYAYEVSEEGAYTITIETEDDNPFEEGGEAGPTDGTIENW